MNDLKFDNHRLRVKQCPCGRSNKDGKFAPLKGYVDKGYCHSCGKAFQPDKEDDSWMYEKGRTNSEEYHSGQIDSRLMERTITGNDNFTIWLNTIFPEQEVQNLILRYNIGTSKHWNGATVFWQADKDNIVRAGKVMYYDPETGRRDKNRFTWVHKLANIADYLLQQCLFGLHLLNEKKLIGIVESEKSAVVCSMYFPDLSWMACGGLQGLTVEKLRPLKGYRVILFPDANGFNKWKNKANELQSALPGFNLTVSDLLEKSCTDQEKIAGLDLCDFLLQTLWTEFRKQQKEKERNLPQF